MALLSLKSLVFMLFILSASTSVLSPIKYFIIIVMENRSFDHLLGYLHQTNPNIDGLIGNEKNYYDVNNPNGKFVTVNPNGLDISPTDPGHGFDDQAEQIYGIYHIDTRKAYKPLQNGFVANSVRHKKEPVSNPMSMFTKTTAPIINTLATEFAVFDKWHASIPGPTDPNRACIMSGTSRGILHNFDHVLWPQKSYFKYLSEHNISWGAYYQDDPWAIMYFKDMHEPQSVKHVHHLDKYFTDLKDGTLSRFTFLQPRMTSAKGAPTWQHPSASVQEGERLIQQVYESLRKSKYWNEAALAITYDEHGGFYDHVKPPQDGVPSPDGINASNGFAFNRQGMRVPMVLVSPLIPKGTVVHEPNLKPFPTSRFDHTSLIATASKIFGISSTPLTKRVAWAGTFEDIFSLATPRTDCPMTLPPIPPLHPEKLEAIRRAPLSDHLEIQVNFFCKLRYPGNASCHDRAFPTTQHASLFVDAEAESFMRGIKEAGLRWEQREAAERLVLQTQKTEQQRATATVRLIEHKEI